MEPRKYPEVKCPTCGKKGNWLAAPHGPFCSSRCKMVDLGKWFSEEHVISEPLKPEFFDDYAHLPPGDYLDRPENEDEQ